MIRTEITITVTGGDNEKSLLEILSRVIPPDSYSSVGIVWEPDEKRWFANTYNDETGASASYYLRYERD